MIKVKNLRYQYPNANAPTLTDINFEINEGEIVGFLGPSGAGKSTTQNILIKMLNDYQGQIEILGKELSLWERDYFTHIGVSFELPNHFLKLSAKENLEHFKAFYHQPCNDIMQLLEWVDLKDHAEKAVSDFSKGMKIRLNVARSILHKPKILFLDEPTSGLDPVNAAKIKDLIFKLRAQGVTIFITTHNMTLADQMCDRVAFITGGTIKAIDSPQKFKQQFGQRKLRVEYLDEDQNEQVKHFNLDRLKKETALMEIIDQGYHIKTMHSEETSLEQVFIQITGEELHS